MLENPILITGAARSGTSIVSGLINQGGAWGGELAPGNSNNPNGFFENIAIRNGVVKPFLKKVLRVDPLGQKPLPDIVKCVEMAPEHGPIIRQKVLSIIKNQKYDGEQYDRWFYKAPKMCLMWPIWAEAFPDASWIITKRNIEGNITSCMKTPFMQKRKTREDWGDWLKTHYARFDEMKITIKQVFTIDVEKIIDGVYDEVEELFDRLELDFDPLAIQSFIRPEYWERG